MAPVLQTHAERFEDFCRTLDAEAYLAGCRAALEADPDAVSNRLGYAQAIGHCGDYETRLALLRDLVAEYPRSDKPNVALGIELMALGRYREGWPHYRYRNHGWKKTYAEAGLPPDKEWQGQPLQGRAILLRREQGIGDTLHFVRNVIPLQRMGVRPLLDVQGAMRTLLGQSPALGTILEENDKVTPHFWVRMMDLVPVISATLEDVEWPGAYVAAPARAAPLGFARQGGLRVGLAWGGNPDFAMNAFRIVPLPALEPLAGIDGCRFYSLMPDTSAAEVAAAGGWLTDLSAISQPFDQLAAVVAQMDVVVTVCTSIAHLAGAMGKPTILMLSKLGEWRWTRSGDTTPWYPSMRIVRQRHLGDWGPVVEDVAAALRVL